VADAGEALHAVAELDALPVPRVRPHVVPVHRVDAREGDGERGAAASLQAKAERRAVLEACALVGTARREANRLHLAARVLRLEVLAEHLLPQPGRQQRGELARARHGAGKTERRRKAVEWAEGAGG